MTDLLNTNSEEILNECILKTREALEASGDPSVKLTLLSLIRFNNFSGDKPKPTSSTRLKEAVVRTGAYYFGPLFVLSKGTSVPSQQLYNELENKGFYTESLSGMNNAQLNLFFITLKCMGLVSDSRFSGYIRYGV